MENVDKKPCECGMHGPMGGHGCHGGKCHLIKMILKIFIIILIFWCGFKLGDITGSIKGEYGHRMMDRDNFGTNVVAPTPTPAK
jgi:uncharacterized membrane protein